ncbi:serine hydrolase FSH [Cladorrhinum sp. PSN332]|nr:serine hydrolase FSH [Cladorrhinum sp. PSN332]
MASSSTKMATPSTLAKPKILLLHGAGTNPTIFKIQARKLVSLLSRKFEMVYLPGFIECGPGPGVLPYFEGAGPYLKWMTDATFADEELHWTSGLERLMTAYNAHGPFHGVIGFSQGAKAGMYLVRQLEQERRPVKFFVSICGTAPFQGVKEGKKGEKLKQSLEKGVVMETNRCYHFIGIDDPYRPESEALTEFFEARAGNIWRFEGGHHMPAKTSDNEYLGLLCVAAIEGE